MAKPSLNDPAVFSIESGNNLPHLDNESTELLLQVFPILFPNHTAW